MNNLAGIAQCDYDFCGVTFHQPTIKEIARLIPNEDTLLFILKLFTIDLISLLPKEIINTEDVTEFKVFIFLLTNDTQFLGKNKKKGLLNFFKLVFPNTDITIGENEIVISNEEENQICIMDDKVFDRFKKLIYKFFKLDILFNNGEEEFKPANAQVAAIIEKIKKGRQKIAEQKGAKERTLPLLDNYISILSVGLKLSPAELSNLTMYNILSDFKRFQMNEEWDIDIKCRLAGGDPKEHPEYWMTMI